MADFLHGARCNAIFRSNCNVRIACRSGLLGLVLTLAVGASARADLEYVTQWGSSGTGEGQFTAASGIASDGAGTIYVTDAATDRVQRFDADGTFVAAFGGPGAAPGQYSRPAHIAADGFGSVYVSDPGNFRVQKLTALGTPVHSWGSAGTNDGQFEAVAGVATDSLGNVYVVDSQLNRVQRFTPEGVYDLKWGATGIGRSQFSSAQDVTVDVFGDVYVIDAVANRVQKFTSDGGWLNAWGSKGAREGQFDGPLGIGTDAAGNVYVADTGNNRVQSFASDGTFLSQSGGLGSGQNRFNRPVDAAADETGAVYVADQANHRVQELAEPTRPLPPPVLYETANVARVSGTVLVQRPGSPRFVALDGAQQIPIGSKVKVNGGMARLTTASNVRGGQQTARFYAGQFTVMQPRAAVVVTELKLTGGGFERCTKGGAGARAISTAYHKRARRPRRRLWGDGKGRFKTAGRYGTAGVRGTIWLTEDTCDSTLIRVRRGTVEVTDLVLNRTVIVRKGQSYRARRG